MLTMVASRHGGDPCDCQCHAMGSAWARCSIDGGCGRFHRADGPARRCHRAARCAGAARDPHDPATLLGAPIMAERGLCLTCQRVTTSAIAALPMDYVNLTLHLPERGTGLTQKVSATPTPPIPLALHLFTLGERIVERATRWAEPVAERLNITWDSRFTDHHTRPGAALQRATRILAANLPVLLALTAQPGCEWDPTGTQRAWEDADGLDGALELLRCHELTRARLRHTKLVHQLPAPCPACDHMSLARVDGQSQVDCRNPRCNAIWSESDYDRLVHILAVDYAPSARE